MKHRNVAIRVCGLEAAVDFAIMQYKLCQQIFWESTGLTNRSSDFCDRELFYVLTDISGCTFSFFYRYTSLWSQPLKEHLAKLQKCKESVVKTLACELDDGVTMRRSQLIVLIQALEAVEKRVDECIYATQQ